MAYLAGSESLSWYVSCNADKKAIVRGQTKREAASSFLQLCNMERVDMSKVTLVTVSPIEQVGATYETKDGKIVGKVAP